MFMAHNTGLHTWEYTDYGTLENISPILYGPSYTDFHGAVKALAIGTDWTYAILEPTTYSDNLFTDTKSKIMAVGYRYIANAERQMDWRWHTLAECDLDEVYDADVHSNKLWISGTKSGTAAIKSFVLDSTTPIYFNNGGLGVQVAFQIDGAMSSTSWTELAGAGLGEFTSSKTIPFQDNQNGKRIRYKYTFDNDATPLYQFITSYYDAGLPGETKSFRTFSMEGDTLAATGTTQTPFIRMILTRTVQRTPPLRIIWCVVQLDDDIEILDGTDMWPASTVKGYIDALASEADPITLYDIHGSTVQCIVLPYTPREYEVEILTDDPRRTRSRMELMLQQIRTS